jgi:L-asparaginase II
MSLADAVVPVAATRRSGVDESVHFGAVVAIDVDGVVAAQAGDPAVPIYPRSCNKPLQATAMVDLGLAVPHDELAVACASHDGAAAHEAAVRRLLAGVGLDESALRNTPDLPLDAACAEHVLRSGGSRAPIHMNCSGKHAAMVATCVVNGWDVESYLDPAHPLQQVITATVAGMSGGVTHVGVDGCGAPAHVTNLLGLAHAFRSLATVQGAVWRAMTEHPEMVGGPTRDVTVLMRAVPGLMAKDGAEGVFAAALPDGRAVALKVADGASRARPAVMVAALRVLGVEVAGLDEQVVQAVRGHGRRVGEVRSLVFTD